MTVSNTSSLRLSLTELEKVLSRGVRDTDLLGQLSRKLSEHQVISKEVYRIFVSLDRDRLEVKLMVRYLLRHVWEKVESEDSTYSTFIEVLSELGLQSLCETLTLAMSNTNEATGIPLECPLLAKDIPLLMTKLAKVTYKWRDICIAVGLPINVLMECENRGDNVAKLYQVIWEWVTGNHEHARSPTLSNLNECLTGPLVGVPEISLNTGVSISREPQHENQQPTRFKVVYESGDCKVADTMSTLLEVRASIVEGVTYRWMKDGKCLSDCEDYCGTSTDILVIKHAHQGMEGVYTCIIKREEERLVSEGTQLKIVYSQDKECLLKMYARQREVPRDSWPPVIADTFTNLVLVKQTKKHQHKHPSPIRGNVDDIDESKEEISYESVFGTYQSGSLVLVEGRPGSGKTTLVHKVVRDWAIREGTLKGAKLVFLVRLRLLQSNKNYGRLSDLLEIIYGSLNVSIEISSRVANYIETVSGDRVCIILDGLDEYKNREIPESIVYQLSRMKSLYKAMVIVTSRPVASRELRESDVELKRTEVVGFNRNEVCHYIFNYPFQIEGTDKQAFMSKINSHFKSHPNLFHMCSLPVQAAMICYLFQDFQGLLPVTETKMYLEFTNSLILRSLHRRDNSIRLQSFKDIPDSEKRNFLCLCHLAYDMTIRSAQVANHSEVQHFISSTNYFDDSFFLGLMNIEHFSDRRGPDKIYSFLHLTLQEYLAAYHIASLSHTDQINVIQKYGRFIDMYKVWPFFFGSMKMVDKLVDLAKMFPYEELIYPFLFQCAFESQLRSVCDEVKSLILGSNLCLWNTVINPMDFVAIKYVLEDNPPILCQLIVRNCSFDRDCGSQFLSFISSKCNLNSTVYFELLHCNLTSQCVLELVRSIQYNKSLNAIILNQCCLCSEGLVMLANWMKNNTSVTEFDISGNPLIDYNGMAAIAEVLESDTVVKKLVLSPCNVTEDPSVISNLLKNNSTIQVFLLMGYREIWKDDFGVGWDSFMVAFMEGLQSNKSVDGLFITSKFDIRSFINMLLCNSTIVNVTLRECVLVGEYEFSDVNQLKKLIGLTIDYVDMNPENVTVLLNGLKDSLQVLHLYCNKLGDSGIRALESSLRSSKLWCLSIMHNRVGPESVSAIVDLLNNNQSIHDLDLTSNMLGSEGMTALAKYLTSCRLRELGLSNNDIGPDAGKAIAEIISNNQMIRKLDLDRNRIGPDGIIALSGGVRNCCLKELNISNNNLTPTSGNAIADLLCCNHSIQLINLTSNKLGSKGVVALAAAIKHCGLEELYLSDNDIGPDAGKAIADLLVNCHSIQRIYLNNNKLGSNGIIALAAKLKDCDLILIDLSLNHIGPNAGRALADLINNNKIRNLDLVGNSLGLDGIKTLAKYKSNSITNLCIEGNNVSPVNKDAILPPSFNMESHMALVKVLNY